EIYNAEIVLVITINTRWTSVFECFDHILRVQSAIYAVLAEENVEINDNIKDTILNHEFWLNLKKL
ncbi:11854_t:CDS:1, partial [Racocetra fulgida]